MHITEKEAGFQSAGKFAWFAARDARMRSLVNATTFTDKQKIKAERVKFALEMVYSNSGITVDYCKSGSVSRFTMPKSRTARTCVCLKVIGPRTVSSRLAPGKA